MPNWPSMDPGDKRLAIRVEDHELDYASCEGIIPAGAYRAGAVIVWDRGTYRNRTRREGRKVPLRRTLRLGHLAVEPHGQKLRGGFALTRTSIDGQDLTATYPELVETIAAQDLCDLIADGEIVAFEGGRTSFARLQRRMQIHDPERARVSAISVYLYLFDLLELDGDNLRSAPLRERKRRLRRALRFGDRLRWTPYRVGDAETAYRHACTHGWKGVIAKRADSAYVPARSRDWRKIKCSHGQELVIGGWTAGRGARRRLGALLLGYCDGDRLRYAGKVGTGFDSSGIERLANERR